MVMTRRSELSILSKPFACIEVRAPPSSRRAREWRLSCQGKKIVSASVTKQTQFGLAGKTASEKMLRVGSQDELADLCRHHRSYRPEMHEARSASHRLCAIFKKIYSTANRPHSARSFLNALQPIRSKPATSHPRKPFLKSRARNGSRGQTKIPKRLIRHEGKSLEGASL